MSLPIPHLRKLFLFASLSAADLCLTWWLLERSGGDVYEGNPVAQWCLAHYGWAGLAAFKAAVVALVGTLALVITRSRPRLAGRVLAFACATVGLVVLYSCCLASPAGAAFLSRMDEKRQALLEPGSGPESVGRRDSPFAREEMRVRRRLMLPDTDDVRESAGGPVPTQTVYPPSTVNTAPVQ